jgi:S1-C subfamily serine protease
VLIADLDASAAKNGIERGDIITQVGLHEVGSPAEFAREANTEPGRTVVLRVSHDGAEHSISFAR